MPSTFSRNYSIELITTGEQAGQWGDTTNRNYQRFEQMAGGVATITIDDLPEGSLSTWDGSIFEWYTSDTAEAGEVNSEGRCKYVSFASEGFIGGNATVKIFGSDSTKSPTRVFIVSNDLMVDGDDKPTITFKSGPSSTATVTVDNGNSALVYNESVNVKNILDSLTFDSLDVGTIDTRVLDFSGAESSGDAQIKIANGFAEAFRFVSGSGSNVIRFDTSGSTNTINLHGDVRTQRDLQVDGDLTVVTGDTSTNDLDIDGDLSVTGNIVGGLMIREIVIVPDSDTGGVGTGEEKICGHTFNFTSRTGNSRVLIIGSVQLEADPNQTNTGSGGTISSRCTVRMQRKYSGGALTPLTDNEQVEVRAECFLVPIGRVHSQYTANYPILAYVDNVPGGGTAEFQMTGTQTTLASMKWSNSGMILIDFGETP